MERGWISLLVPPVIALIAAMTNERSGRAYWALAIALPAVVAALLFLSSEPRVDALPTEGLALTFAFLVLPTAAVFFLLRLPGFRGRRAFSFLVGVACYIVILLLGIGFVLDLGLARH